MPEITDNMQEKLLQINKDVKSITKTATDLVIKTAEDMTPAAELLKNVVVRKKRIEEIRLFFTKPLNDHIKQINNQFKASSEPLEAIESDIKRKMLIYRQEEQARIRKEQEALLKKAESMKTEKKQEEYKEKAEDLKQETKVESKSGEIRFRKVWKFELINGDEVPREYLEVNETSIRRAIMNGVREIKGVRIYEEELPSTY